MGGAQGAFLTAAALRARALRRRAAPLAICAPTRRVRACASAATAAEPELGVQAQAQTHTLLVSAHETGQRVDKLLAERLDGDYSRSHIQWLIARGNVHIDGKLSANKSRRVVRGEAISVHAQPPPSATAAAPEHMALHVLYEDEQLLVLNKAAGMVVHPAPGHWRGTLVNALAARYQSLRAMHSTRAGIVHRLDKGTSGVMVVAKTALAHERLSRLFAARAVQKDYLAITVNDPCAPGCRTCTIEQPIARDRANRLRMAVTPPERGGRRARSVATTLAHDERALLHAVQLSIETGRTHQIRVHLRHRRAPVLGDALYGAIDVNRRFERLASRPMLHAWRLRFVHPFSGQSMCHTAPIPPDMAALLAHMGAAQLVTAPL